MLSHQPDIIEFGLPFSDPMADGPIIQEANKLALRSKLSTQQSLDLIKYLSKSKNNIINIFLPNNKLKKQIMSIKTDSLSVESPKNPDACNVFKLYSLIGKEKDVIQMKEKLSLIHI